MWWTTLGCSATSVFLCAHEENNTDQRNRLHLANEFFAFAFDDAQFVVSQQPFLSKIASIRVNEDFTREIDNRDGINAENQVLKALPKMAKAASAHKLGDQVKNEE
jgi:hypothetical protein